MGGGAVSSTPPSPGSSPDRSSSRPSLFVAGAAHFGYGSSLRQPESCPGGASVPGTGSAPWDHRPSVTRRAERNPLMPLTSFVERWVENVAAVAEPGRIAWCDGSKAEYERLVEDMVGDGTLLPLNART